MSRPSPLVSIIIPSFNQGAFIRETLESILEQDYRPIEIIVVDGASSDETVAVLHEYDHIPEVRWVSEPDRGVIDAVNKGFGRAQGEIAAIQSSDDYYLPGAIRLGVEALLADPTLGFVYGDILKVDSEGSTISKDVLAPYSLDAVFAGVTWIPQPSTFFRLELARSLSGWREEVPYAADTDLWLRMAHHAGARKLDAFLAARRVHGAQRDQHGDRILRDYARMLTLLFQEYPPTARRRRAAASGMLLQRNRYAPDGHGLLRCWGAVLVYPESHHRMLGLSMIPGWFAVRRLASRVKGFVRARRLSRSRA